jgi:hypothetical protein
MQGVCRSGIGEVNHTNLWIWIERKQRIGEEEDNTLWVIIEWEQGAEWLLIGTTNEGSQSVELEWI